MGIDEMTAKKKKEDHYVYFKGAKLTKREANIGGLSILFGLIGTIGVVLVPVETTRAIGFGIIMLFIVVGYIVGSRIFK